MKVAIISSALIGRGGMETAFSGVYSLFSNDSKYSINYIFTDGIKQKSFLNSFNKNDVFYHEHTSILGELLFLIKMLLKNKYDVLIVTSKKTIIFTYFILKVFRIKEPLVSWLHFSVDEKGMYLNLSKYGDAHFAISKAIKKQISNIGVSDKRIYYLPNFVNISNDTITKSKEDRFVYVGRIEFEGQKNLKELIDGLSKIKGKWSIDIYGDGDDLIKSKLYLKINYPYLSKRFYWKGWSDDPWRDISKATCLILTSKMEGMPMVLLESISRGLPVLSSNCETGPQEIVNEGINGYLYKPGCLDDFRYKLEKLVNTNFSTSTVKKSIHKFEADNYKKRFQSYLENIVKDYHNLT